MAGGLSRHISGYGLSHTKNKKYGNIYFLNRVLTLVSYYRVVNINERGWLNSERYISKQY